MKTPEEIKKGIECCTCPTSDCDQCPYHKVGDGDCVDEVKHDALAYIRQLEARVPRWIPVEERLPEKHLQECLCRYVFDEIPGVSGHIHVLTWHAYGTNGYVYRPHFTDEGFESMRVTHWMPLPEPPEEVQHK